MRHRKTTRPTLLCVLSALCATCFVLAPAANTANAAGAAPDLSTPKKAAVAFATAIAAGDMDGVKAASVGTDEDYKGLSAMLSIVRSMKRFQAAAAKRYDDAKEMPDMTAAMTKNIEGAQEKIDGDTATLINKDQPEDKPRATLKRIGGQWKMDLKSISTVPQFTAMKNVAAKATQAIDGVTADVEAGTYATFAKARDALQEAVAKSAAPK